MLRRKTLPGQCRSLMFKAPAPLQIKLFSIFTNVEKASILRTRELHFGLSSPGTQQTVRWISLAGDQSHDQKSADLLPSSLVVPRTVRWSPLEVDRSHDQEPSILLSNLGSEGTPYHDQDSNSDYASSLSNHSPPEVGSTVSSIEPGCDATLKPWRNVLSSFEERKQRKRTVNRLRKDRGLLSYDWRIPLRALEEHHDQNIEDEEISQPYLKAPQRISRLRSKAPQRAGRPIRQKHAEQITPPPVWTRSTFTNYVHDLTTSSVDSSAKYHLYGQHGSHAVAVSDILEKLFNKVATKDLLSTYACNAAMLFFFKHNQVSKARAVFIQMEHLDQEIYTPTVNILLLAAANQGDLHNFTFMLKQMLLWGLRPDATTWSALLIAVESNEVRAVIIESMRKRNLLKRNAVIRDIVTTIIRDEVIRHLDSGSGLDSFLSSLDSQYGTGWLSVSAANNLLDEVGRRKGVQEAIRLFDDLTTRGLMPDQVTLGTLLQICRFYAEQPMATQLLQQFELTYGVAPAQDSYNILFGMAWNTRKYNFLRVIWRSACVNGFTSSYMRNLVLRSLRSEEENPPEGKRKNNSVIWRNSAGAVAVGVTPQNAYNLHTSYPNVAMADIQHIKDGNAAEIGERLERLFFEDLANTRRHHLEGSLFELLKSAQVIDDEWHSSGDWKAKSTAWKCENAIKITVTQHQPRST